MVDGKGGFDQAGRSCGGLGVSDVGFDRSQRATVPIGGGLSENLAKRLKFNLIAHPCTGAVSLHQPDAGRIHAGFPVGPAQGPGLTFGPGRIDAVGSAVAG